MMKLKYLTEDFDLARRALAHWPHDEATLTERLGWFRISASAIYPFDDPQGRLCFLRLHPAEEKPSRELLGELDFLTYLQRLGYPALRPIPSTEGETLLPIDTPQALWFVSAFTGVPGQPLEDLPMNSMLAWAYGDALGRLHAASMRYHPPIRQRSHSDGIHWIRLTLETHQAPAATLAQLEEVTRQLSAIPRTRANYGLVHYDFEPDNVFWDGADCHAIDFGDAMMHFYAIDLVRALDEMEEEYHAAFLDGYYAACPASEAQQADFPLMRRFRDLYSYARLLHSLSERPELPAGLPPQPEWMPQLVERLQTRRDELLQSICGR